MAIVVVPYDDSWPDLFAQVCGELAPVFTGLAPVFHHVGSTSVPGLAAKPKIDLHAAFADPETVATAVERMQAIPGYTYHGDKYGDQSWTFTSGRGSYGARLYLCTLENHVLRDRILFRNYLSAHPERAAAYAALKLRLMGEAKDDWGYYTGGKTEFVRETVRLAELQRR